MDSRQLVSQSCHTFPSESQLWTRHGSNHVGTGSTEVADVKAAGRCWRMHSKSTTLGSASDLLGHLGLSLLLLLFLALSSVPTLYLKIRQCTLSWVERAEVLNPCVYECTRFIWK